MAKPPGSPPSKDHGADRDTPAKDGGPAGAAKEQDVSRRQSAGRPPQTKQ